MTNEGRSRRIFWGGMLLAVAFRVAAFNPYAIHHPDEALQYLEQAHRLAFGYGIVPWEFRYMIRSFLYPLLLVPPMALGEAIEPGGTLYLILPRAMIALANLATVWAAWTIGRRQSHGQGIVAMAAAALWVEAILFGVSLLSEALATAAILAAAGLLQKDAPRAPIVAAGALLTFAALIRFQYAPAIVAFVLVLAWRDRRVWTFLLMGGLPVLAAGAAVDLAFGQPPFGWVVANIRLNLIANRMSEFGGDNPRVYFRALRDEWSWAGMIIIPLLAARVWREQRALIAAAAANLLFHHLIGHREYRFVWLSVQIAVILAAMGSAKLAEQGALGARLKGAGGTAALVLLWGAASLALYLSRPVYQGRWRDDGGASRLGTMAMRDGAVCALGVRRDDYNKFGYVLMHRDKPIYLLPEVGPQSITAPGAPRHAFNAAVTRGAGPVGFAKTACVASPLGPVCLYRRVGGCSPDPASDFYVYQRALQRDDR